MKSIRAIAALTAFWAGTCVSAQELLLPPISAPPTSILPVPIPVAEKPLPKIWTGGLEFGLSGAEGNSQNFKFRMGVNAKAETERNLFKLNALYSYSKANEADIENRGLTKARYERLYIDSRWSLFLSGELEYDEFKAFDLRIASHAGVAYAIIKNEDTLLKSRFGAGASREINSPNEDVKPELLFGLDLERKISARQKICVTGDFFPTVHNFGDYRFEGRISYEILIDPEWNLTLKLGVLDRYDSTPEGKQANDYEYFATLLWKF